MKHDTNESKSTALAQSLFPPPPANITIPVTDYPEPLEGVEYFTKEQIRDKIRTLAPYKAPGPDGIPNVVLTQCADLLTEYLYYIYRVILELDTYYEPWLHSITVVL